MPMGARGSALIISSVGHKHRGNYTCQAKNLAGKRFETVELKVNGKSLVRGILELEIFRETNSSISFI